MTWSPGGDNRGLILIFTFLPIASTDPGHITEKDLVWQWLEGLGADTSGFRCQTENHTQWYSTQAYLSEVQAVDK